MTMTLNNLGNYTPLANIAIPDTVTLIIPYPLKSDEDFNRLENLCQTHCIYLSRYIFDFLKHDDHERSNFTFISSLFSEGIYQEIAAVLDSIPVIHNRETKEIKPENEDDYEIYGMLEMSLHGGYDVPTSAINISELMVAMLYKYYSGIYLPDDYDLFTAEWDYELNMLNSDSAVITFVEKENVISLTSLMYNLPILEIQNARR